MKTYCCGFIFDLQKQRILLLRKKPGTPNAGKWNGIGGKIEENETPLDAMIRETKEEIGLNLRNWNEFCELTGIGPRGKFKVYFFRVFTNKISEAKQIEEEQIEIFNIKLLPNIVPNLNWLIPMALNIEYDSADKFTVQEANCPTLADQIV